MDGRSMLKSITCWAIALGLQLVLSGAGQSAERANLPPVVTAVKLQPGGSLMATAGDDHLVRIFNRETGELERRLDGHTDWVRAVAFTPDGSSLATAGNDRRIVVWDPTTGEDPIEFAALPCAVACIAFDPQGDSLAAVGFDGRLRIYAYPSGKLDHEVGCPCNDMRCVQFSPDGSLLAGAGRNGIVRIWNAQTHEKIRDITAHRRRVRGMAFSPDGASIASASEGGDVRISMVQTGEGYPLPKVSAKSMSLVYVDRNTLAVGGSDNHIRLWNLTTRTQPKQLQGHTGTVIALDCIAGVLASGSYDASVRSWDVGGTEGVQIGAIPTSRK